MTHKKRIIKDSFNLTSARYASQFIGFFTSIAMKRFLGPFYTGIWSLLNIISDNASYLLLGIGEGVCYKIPFLLGEKKEQEAEEVKDVAFNFVFAVSCLTSLAVLVAAVILRHRYPVEVIVGLCAVSLYMLVDRICGYYMTLLRARKNFSVLSLSIIFDAVVNLCLVILLVKNFRIYGLYAALIILTVLNVIFVHLFVRYRLCFNFKFKGAGGLIKIGFPLSFLGFLQGVAPILDTIMITKMIGVTFVGYYSVSVMTKNYISQLSSFGTVLYPWLLETFGRNQSIEDIKKYAIIPPKVNAYLLPLLLGWIFFIVPVLIKAVLPKFIPGILAIQILLIDMFFRSCYPQAMHFLIALKKQTKMMTIMILSIILTALLNYALIKAGYGIYGVACAASAVSFIMFFLMQTYAMRHFAGGREIALFFLEVIAPFLYTTLFVLLIENFIRLPNMYVNAAVKCFTLFIFSIPLLIYIDSRTQVVRLVLDMVKGAILRKADR